jgi:predicted branched-subunit amino acid permease
MESNFFRQGAKAGMVIGFSTMPFGLLFGAVAVDGGMTPFEATMMSGIIFGGASQLVGVQMFGTNVPAWLIVLSVFAVNFRHILYSAALSPHLRNYSRPARLAALFFLTDPQFAEASKQVDHHGKVEPAWYFGMALVVYGLWLASSAIGALFGRLVGNPQALGFDVLLPVYFLGLVLGFRRRPLFAAVIPVSAGASILAMHTVGSPWHVSIGALAGVIAALFLHKPAETVRDGETL